MTSARIERLRLATMGRLALIAAVVGTGFLVITTEAMAHDDPATLLRKARDASATANIAGVVEVRWTDGDQVLVERVGARSRGDAYVVGRGQHFAVARDGVRYAADDGVATLWGQGAQVDAPGPAAAWDLELNDPAQVAGRTASVVIARDDAGRVRARFYVDRATQLLLRRDVFDRSGTLTRSVRFVRLSTGAAAPAVPQVPEKKAAVTAIDDVPDGFTAPHHLGAFLLLGRYRHPDGTLQLFYGDGLFSLSVFEQGGLVDWDAMPEGGRPGRVEDQRARTYSTAAGTVVVWGERGLVITGVSDAPADAVRAVLPAVANDDRSTADDVVDFVFGPFGWE
jgi:sigma-E factor negative regulatory protein RseB